MAIYAIGDIHGCLRSLEALLERIPFDRRSDRLWLAGDLVNRGPDSLGVLRWARNEARELGDRFACVLGNHDLHLLARARGLAAAKKKDTLHEVLGADDLDVLIDWLGSLPLALRLDGRLLVHGGIDPAWTISETLVLAGETAATLRSHDGDRLLRTLYAGTPKRWSDDLGSFDRQAYALSALTRLRTLHKNGETSRFNGPLSEAPSDCTPWFDVENRASSGFPILCGHWAALGLVQRDHLIALDTGCVWGGKLTAVRLDDGEVFQQDALESRK